MNRKDRIYLIKQSKDKNKKIIINVILSIIVLVVFSFSESILYYMHHDYLNQYHYRKFRVYPRSIEENIKDNLDAINSINHIVDTYEQDSSEIMVSTISLDNEKYNGDMWLSARSDEQLKKLSNNKYKNKYSIICSENFINDVDAETNYLTSRYELMNMKKYIGKNLEIRLKNFGDGRTKNIELQIVSTYSIAEEDTDNSSCLASHELVNDIHDWQMEDDGSEEKTFSVYYIELDNINNLDEVEKKLNDMGYELEKTSLLNYGFIKFLKALRYYIIYVVSIFAVVFITKFTMANVENNIKECSIYKSIGMSSKSYEELINTENIHILFRSILYSLISYIIILLMVYITVYFFPFIFMKIPIKPNFVSLIIYYIIGYIVMFISSKYALRKIRKSIDTN